MIKSKYLVITGVILMIISFVLGILKLYTNINSELNFFNTGVFICLIGIIAKLYPKGIINSK